MSATAKKSSLRQLAIATGLAAANDMTLFQKSIEDIYTLLASKYPNIEKLDDEEVLDLTDKAKAKGKDEEPPARGRRGAKDEEEPPARRGRAAKDEEPAEPPARGRGRGAKDEEPAEPARGRRGAKDEEPAEPTRGRRGAKDEPAEPAEPARRGRAAKDEEPAEPATRGRGRGAKDEPAEPAAKDVEPSWATVLSNSLGTVTKGLDALNGRLDVIEKVLAEVDAKVDASDANTTKTLKGMKAQLAEAHVGIESLYLNDIDKKDKDLSDVLKRVQG